MDNFRRAWRQVKAEDYEAHMAGIGQAQANARLTAAWIEQLGERAGVLFAGCGPGQMLDWLPQELLQGRELVFTDLAESLLAKCAERLVAKGLEARTEVDDLEATSLVQVPPNVALVLVLEHTDWPKVLDALVAWQAERVLVVTQENPPTLRGAVTPGISVPLTMQVFREEAKPHLIAHEELQEAMEARGYELLARRTEEVAHGKKMNGWEWAKRRG
ncbi:MAG: class I SAM-dependent methyltransferase [Bryobacter sp.]|nr:class I SAM-dependent methyltransferase [Bryobacter sp.]